MTVEAPMSNLPRDGYLRGPAKRPAACVPTEARARLEVHMASRTIRLVFRDQVSGRETWFDFTTPALARSFGAWIMHDADRLDTAAEK